MDSAFLKYITVLKLPVIETIGGSVLKGLLCTENSFNGFGEVYFSEVEPGAIKAWKYHKEMTLNLVVPKGKVKFVFCIRENNKNIFKEIIIGRENYNRISVKPGIWFGFQGLHTDVSIVMNVADILHKPEEVDRLNINDIDYNW